MTGFYRSARRSKSVFIYHFLLSFPFFFVFPAFCCPFFTASRFLFFLCSFFFFFDLSHPEQCVCMLVSEALRSIDSSSYNGVQHFFFFFKKSIKMIFKKLMLELVSFYFNFRTWKFYRLFIKINMFWCSSVKFFFHFFPLEYKNGFKVVFFIYE